MRFSIFAAAAAVCLCLPTYTTCAAPPRATVTGPSAGVPGDILVLDSSESIADHFSWVVTPELPDGRPTILALEGGRKCLVCSVPGVYTVVLAASNAEGVDQAKWTITVGPQPGPTPPPGPDPPPGPQPGPDPQPTPPEPDLPDGVYKLTRFARDLANSVVSPNRAVEAAALAGGFEGVAAAIAGGTLKTPQQIRLALLAANNAAVGESLKYWLAWGTAIGNRLGEMIESKQLAAPEDWVVALNEIALGLRAVASKN